MNKELLRQAVQQNPAAIMQPYDTIYDTCGFDAVCAFIEHFGGMTIYVPGEKKIFLKCIEKDIKNKLNETNIDSMAIKYGYSKRHLRRLLNEKV